MPNQFKIEFTEEAKKLVADVEALPENSAQSIAKAMDGQNELTVARVMTSYLSFPAHGPTVPIGCRYITGGLRRSLFRNKAAVSGNVITSAIGAHVKYGAAQEFGADYPAMTIRAKNGKALRFPIGGRIVFAKSVRLPARHLEGRHFIERGIADRWDNYSTAISSAVIKTFQK